MVGPAGAFVSNLYKAFDAASTGDYGGALAAMSPVAIVNAMKALDMWQTGMYRDSRGRKVMDTTALDAAVKSIGFQPQKVAIESRKIGEQMQNIRLHGKVEAKIAERMAEGYFERVTAKDATQRKAAQEKIEGARKELSDWNRRNPDAKIAITGEQITRRVREKFLSRSDRIVKRAPPEIRRDVRESID